MTHYIPSTEGPVVYPSSRRRLHRVGALAVTALITPHFLGLPLATAVDDPSTTASTTMSAPKSDTTVEAPLTAPSPDDSGDHTDASEAESASDQFEDVTGLLAPLLLTDTKEETVSGTTEDGASVEIPYSVEPGETVKLTGENWKSTDGSTGSTLVVKLYYQLADGEKGTYQRTGDNVVNHPKNGNPEPTIWKLFKADNDGTFSIDLDLPKDLEPGQKLSVTVTSGLASSADAQRSLVLDPLKISGVEWVEPDKGDTITCTPSTDKALVTVAPTAVPGGTLKISGTGFCHPTDGGSKIAIKIDDGLYKHVSGHKVHDNDTIWAIVQADDHTGDFTIDLTLPDGTTSGPYGSDPAFTTGAHTIRILTGTLKEGDKTRTLPKRGSKDTEFVVGDYRPSGIPEPLHYTENLTEALRGGISATRDNDQLAVTIPGAQPGDWIFASAYIDDTSRRLPWDDNWYTVTDSGQVILPLTDSDIPEGPLKLVLQSGNQGHTGELVGWTPITLKERPGDSTDEMAFIFSILPIATAIDGFSGKLTELSRALNGLAPQKDNTKRTDTDNRTSDGARESETDSQRNDDPGDSVVTVIRRRSTAAEGGGQVTGNRGGAAQGAQTPASYPAQPENTPKPPVLNIANLTPRRQGNIESAIDDEGVLTLTVPDLKAGDWVYLFTYGPKPEAIGWAQLDENKQMLLDVSGLSGDNYKVALVDSSENLLGWVDVPGGEATTSSHGGAAAYDAQQASVPKSVAATAPLMTGADWAFILGAFAIAQLAMLAAMFLTRRRS
ncbi:hypothetical protein OS128_12355 [Corynebacterium sp. P5848]|uniref:hypothetical protein n=1 Tax=Corynebacterium marambiense TaxID=2765364 RepID=UPI002260A588|nr:hypothetical protein [Corynebacterium marambiense]MCX7543697.1 hypothetical protein [Corynebacterium marambiense]